MKNDHHEWADRRGWTRVSESPPPSGEVGQGGEVVVDEILNGFHPLRKRVLICLAAIAEFAPDHCPATGEDRVPYLISKAAMFFHHQHHLAGSDGGDGGRRKKSKSIPLVKRDVGEVDGFGVPTFLISMNSKLVGIGESGGEFRGGRDRRGGT